MYLTNSFVGVHKSTVPPFEHALAAASKNSTVTVTEEEEEEEEEFC